MKQTESELFLAHVKEQMRISKQHLALAQQALAKPPKQEQPLPYFLTPQAE